MALTWEVTIKIVTTETDPYSRYHGKTVDQSLDSGFWSTQRDKIIKTTGSGFTHTQTVAVAEGSHYVIYGNSGSAGYMWHAKIFVNGNLIAEGNVDRSSQLRGDFTISAPLDNAAEDAESFETSFGHWPNASGNDENWTRKSGRTSSSSTGPSSAYSGSYYIYVETSSGHAYSSGDISIVEYNLVGVKDGSVDFRYHQYGSNQGRLYLEGYDGSWRTIWSSVGDHGNTWIHVTKNFSGYSKLRFRNRAAGGYRGDVALDLVRVYVTTIPAELEDTESFESSFGHWPNAAGNKSNWKRKSGSTSSSSTGPSSAYSGSYYIYVETSSGSSYYSGNTDIVEYNLVSRKKGYIDFYYHQYGTNQGRLYLEGYDGSWRTIWSSVGNHGNTWIHVTKNFDGYSKLRFRNRAAGGYRGDVALDLIRVYVIIPTAITVAVSPTPPIKPGTTLTFSGKLKRIDTGAGIAGQTVALEWPPGTKVKSTTTNSAGNYSISFAAPTAPSTYQYRTVFEGTASLSRAESGPLGFGTVEPSLLWALASAFVGLGLLVASRVKD